MTDDLDDLRDEEGMEEAVYPVKCVCDWAGMSDDCKYGRCPDCGDRVRREKECNTQE